MRRLLTLKTDRGIALIAAVFLIVVFGFLGLAVVSLVGTQGFSAMNEVKSDQAFFVAEGGTEFSQRFLAQNLQWYRSTADPILLPAGNLGPGSFSAMLNLPATMARRRVDTSNAPIRAYTTDRFPTSGVIQIEDEFIRYTLLGTDPGTGFPTFAGTITRGHTVGGIASSLGTHERGDVVYPVTTLAMPAPATGLPNNCTPLASITLASHPKFLGAGTIDIEEEQIGYRGLTITGGTMTLTGITRCLNSTGPAQHLNGRPVTPVLSDDAIEAEILSTGTVGGVTGNAARVIRKTVQR